MFFARVEQRQQVADEPNDVGRFDLFENIERLSLPVAKPVVASHESTGVDKKDRPRFFGIFLFRARSGGPAR